MDDTTKSEPVVFLRRLKERDLEWARELHNDPDVLKMLTDPHVVSEEEQKEWFAKLEATNTSVRMVVEHKEQKVGLVRIDQVDFNNHSVCVGLDIHRDFRGKGFAKPVYREIFKYFFEDLGFHRVWLLVAGYNQRARKLYNELGFKEEGIYREALFKEGSYHDYVLMGILEEEYRNVQRLQ